MMVFGYALFVPAAIGLTSAFLSLLLASTLHVTIAAWLLFLVIVVAMVVAAYLGAAGLAVVLVYTAVNISVIRAFRTEFPVAAILVFLFPLWGIFFPGAYTLMNVLPFIALGWLLIGVVAAALIRPATPAAWTG